MAIKDSVVAKGLNNLCHQGAERVLNAKPETTPWSIRQALHDRRSGIEPLIGHTKHGGQMGRSRMRSDETTKSAGYAAVLGFNPRQLTRYVMGGVRQKNDDAMKISSNDANIIRENVIQSAAKDLLIAET